MMTHMSDPTGGTDAYPAHTSHRRGTTVLRGYLGEVTEQRVTIFPSLDARYSIEVSRRDVLSFDTEDGSGRCRIVLPESATVRECVQVLRTARRAALASDLSAMVDRSVDPESAIGGRIDDLVDA